MSKKYRIGEEVVKLFGQTVSGGKISIQEGMLYASQAANKYIRDLIFSNKKLGVETPPYSVLSDYEVEVLKDTVKNKFYAPLPVRALETLLNNMGVFQVTSCDEGELFVPLNKGFIGMFRGLDSYGLEGMLGYIPERDKLWMYGEDFEEGFKVNITLIPDCTSLEADEEIPLPTDAEYDVILMALQLAQVQMQTPQNLETDNTQK